MTHQDFVCRYLRLASSEDDPNTIKLLADVADTNKTRCVAVASRCLVVVCVYIVRR